MVTITVRPSVWYTPFSILVNSPQRGQARVHTFGSNRPRYGRGKYAREGRVLACKAIVHRQRPSLYSAGKVEAALRRGERRSSLFDSNKHRRREVPGVRLAGRRS